MQLRSHTKALAAAERSAEADCKLEEVALRLNGCKISEVIQQAVSERDARDEAGVDDLEPGQHLVYPPSPSLSPADREKHLRVRTPLSSPDTSPQPSPPLPEGSSAEPPSLSLSGDPPGDAQRVKTAASPVSILLNHKKIGKARRVAKKRLKVVPSTYKIRSSLSRRYKENSSLSLPRFKMLTLKTVAQGSWIALRSQIRRGFLQLQDYIDEGLQLVEWDGRTPTLLVDHDGNVCGVLGGYPGTPESWKICRAEATEAMEKAAKQLEFPRQGDRRGPFRTIAVGVSYGGGQTRPGTLSHKERNQKVIDGLMNNSAIRRIAGFQSSVFAFYAPKLYRDYATKLDAIFEKYPELHYNWNQSVFACASFNFGPNALSLPHRDHGNRAAGWCPIYCDGDFDPRRGGHLVLREFGVVVEFPPGSTIAIPSACITHGNVPIRKHETRWSFTQYASGGLFQFLEYGFRSWSTIQLTDKTREKEIVRERGQRWGKELDLLSKVDSLHEDRENAGLLG